VPGPITAAVIAALVALAVSVAGSALTWSQIRRDQQRWRSDERAARALELHRVRLASYPAAFEAIAALSTHHRAGLTAEVAGAVGERLNGWLYSAGGMCAEATTRSAILGLRDSCDLWASVDGTRPPQLYEFRNLAITFLRRDLDLGGLDPAEPQRSVAVLAKLRDDLDALDRRGHLTDRAAVPDR
jgi:hypothetical protein